MSKYPSSPSTIYALIGKSLCYYYSTLKKIIIPILLLALVKNIYVYCGGMPENKLLSSVIIIAMAVVMIYLCTVMLYSASQVLLNNSISLEDACLKIVKCAVKIVFICLYYIVAYVIASLLLMVIAYFGKENHGVILLFDFIIVVIPLLYFILITIFAFPFVLVEGSSVGKAFWNSNLLTMKNWFPVFGLYAFIFVMIVLVTPTTLHWHLLQAYHVSLLFDFVVFAVFLPIIFNLWLLLLNDYKLRPTAYSEQLKNKP